MAKTTPAYGLSDADKRDLIELIQQNTGEFAQKLGAAVEPPAVYQRDT